MKEKLQWFQPHDLNAEKPPLISRLPLREILTKSCSRTDSIEENTLTAV